MCGAPRLHVGLSTCGCNEVAASLRCPVHEWGTLLCLGCLADCVQDRLTLGVNLTSTMPAGVASVESLQQVLKNQNEQLARSNLQTGDQVGQCFCVGLSGAWPI